MTNTNNSFAANFVDTIGEENAKTIFNFLITFSRFECALKSSVKYLQSNAIAMADWSEFGKTQSYKFIDVYKDLDKEIDYIFQRPPKYQKKVGDKIEWVEQHKNMNNGCLCKLIQHIKDIRNNLFHGGKFESVKYNSVDSTDISRDIELISNAIKIIEKLVFLDSDVRKAFFESM